MTPASNFSRVIGFTLHEEGGNVDDPQDPGGRTSRGITQKVWDEFSDAAGWARSDVFTAPQSRIILCYRYRYWNKVNGDGIAWPLALAVFDTGVLHGTKRALQWLALHQDYDSYIKCREASYEAIIARRPTSEKYRADWMGRCRRLRAACAAATIPMQRAA